MNLASFWFLLFGVFVCLFVCFLVLFVGFVLFWGDVVFAVVFSAFFPLMMSIFINVGRN